MKPDISKAIELMNESLEARRLEELEEPGRIHAGDTHLLNCLSRDDLDQGSMRRLRELTAAHCPDQNLDALSDEEFLIHIGATGRNPNDSSFHLTAEIVLLAGRTTVIHELFPQFHMDYFEHHKKASICDNPGCCDYRISDDDFLGGGGKPAHLL